MTDGQKLRASLRANKDFMDSIKPAAPAVLKAAAKAAAKAAPKAGSKTVRGYDSYKRFVGE
jgi:histone H3/H4